MMATDTTLSASISHITHDAPKPTMMRCNHSTSFIFL
jgi:hypothetical protein